jgi:hypothetical protein
MCHPQVELWQKYGKIWARRLIPLVTPQFCHYLGCEPDDTNRSRRPLTSGGVFFAAKGIYTMRKIILAAAIATSALGLAACTEKAETETGEATDAMAADAEAAGDAVADSAETAADATTTGVEDAAENAADAAEETADAIGDKAEEIAADAEAAAE